MTYDLLQILMKESAQKGRRALFEMYCGYVYTIVTSKIRSCGTREDIEECVSDIFAEIYFYIEKNEVKGELKWIITSIARRKSIDYFRKLSRKSGKTVSIENNAVNELISNENITEIAEHSERNNIIYSKIKELGEPDSTIIIQQYFYRKKAKEIAECLNMKTSTVHKRSSRAKVKLRELLLKEGLEAE